MVLAIDCKGNTTWQFAAKRGILDELQKMWDMAKDNLIAEEIKVLLATDNKGNTAWHNAAKKGELDVLQKILD
jgi:hypothetical protein